MPTALEKAAKPDKGRKGAGSNRNLQQQKLMGSFIKEQEVACKEAQQKKREAAKNEKEAEAARKVVNKKKVAEAKKAVEQKVAVEAKRKMEEMKKVAEAKEKAEKEKAVENKDTEDAMDTATPTMEPKCNREDKPKETMDNGNAKPIDLMKTPMTKKNRHNGLTPRNDQKMDNGMILMDINIFFKSPPKLKCQELPKESSNEMPKEHKREASGLESEVEVMEGNGPKEEKSPDSTEEMEKYEISLEEESFEDESTNDEEGLMEQAKVTQCAIWN